MRKIATSCPFILFYLHAQLTRKYFESVMEWGGLWAISGSITTWSKEYTHTRWYKERRCIEEKERMTRWILKGNYLFDNFPLVFHLSLFFFSFFFHIKWYWIIYDFILYQELMHFWVIFGILNFFCSQVSTFSHTIQQSPNINSCNAF